MTQDGRIMCDTIAATRARTHLQRADLDDDGKDDTGWVALAYEESKGLCEEEDHYYEACENKVLGRVYRCCHEGPFSLQKEEIDYGRFVSIEDIMQMNTRELFTPDGIQILQRLIENDGVGSIRSSGAKTEGNRENKGLPDSGKAFFSRY